MQYYYSIKCTKTEVRKFSGAVPLLDDEILSRPWQPQQAMLLTLLVSSLSIIVQHCQASLACLSGAVSMSGAV